MVPPVPLGLCTVTATVPGACAAVVALIGLAFWTVTPAASAPSNLQKFVDT